LTADLAMQVTNANASASESLQDTSHLLTSYQPSHEKAAFTVLTNAVRYISYTELVQNLVAFSLADHNRYKLIVLLLIWNRLLCTVMAM
jgi:hypothetical protein